MDALITPYIQRGLDNATREGVITKDTALRTMDCMRDAFDGVAVARIVTANDYGDNEKLLRIADGETPFFNAALWILQCPDEEGDYRSLTDEEGDFVLKCIRQGEYHLIPDDYAGHHASVYADQPLEELLEEIAALQCVVTGRNHSNAAGV